jgi:hypothetical protein
VPSTLHDGAVDLQDLQDLQERTAVDAADRADDANKTSPPFKVYAAIAVSQLDTAIDEGDDSYKTVIELTKCACARQELPYESDVVHRAVDAAFASLESAKRRFLATAAGIASRTVSSKRSTT